MKTTLLVGMLCMALAAHAAPRVIATLNDPAGDDNGNGSLILPQRNDYQQGDLDLVQLQISRDDEGYWFEATFKNPIRDPAHAFSAVGGEPLSNVARKGFYQFNLDIYIDTDRVPGSGNTFTLPGRKMSVDAAYAWERAVILTPRPEAIRSRLLDALQLKSASRAKEDIAADLDRSVFFPTQVRARGKSVIFLVPAKFMALADAGSWAVTAFVTGAKTDLGVSLSLLRGSTGDPDELDLGVMQPAAGRPRDTFGFDGRVAALPVVDLLLPSPGRQSELLSRANDLPGVAIGAIEPAARAVEAAAPPRAAAAASATPALKELMQPARRAEPPTAGESAAAARPSIAERLETLQQLFDRKLITEAEFREQRRRILNEL